MLSLIRLGLFVLSAAGWCALLARRFSLRAEFCPFLFVSGVGAAQFAAGLLNLYAPAEALLWAGGLLLAGWYTVRCRAAFAPFARLRTLGFGAAAGWLLLLTRGGVIAGYDNMSHWAVMAKTMLRFGRLPNAQNTAIEFTSYPPGSAGWIKYFCGCVGVSDGMMVYAQGLLLLAGLFALTAFLPRHAKGRGTAVPLCGGLLVLAAGVFLLVGDIPPVDLRVDALLAVQAAGALAVIGYYGPRQPKKAAWAAAGPLVLLAVIKNSALFFLAEDLAVLGYFALRRPVGGAAAASASVPAAGFASEPEPVSAPGAAAATAGAPAAGRGGRLSAWAASRPALPAFVGCAVAPFAAFVLWLRHVDLVFEGAQLSPETTSRHAVSLSGYAGILGGKSGEDLAAFQSLFVRHFADLSQPDTRCLWALVLIAALLLGALALTGYLTRRRAAGIGAAMAGCELAYLVCLWATYVFSMSTAEMLCLASIGRYHLTTLLFLAAALVITLLATLAPAEDGNVQGQPDAPRPGAKRATPALLLCAALLLAGLQLLTAPGQLRALYSRAPYHDSSTQGEWLALKAQYGLEDGKRCMVYTRGEDPEALKTWEMRYIARYVMNTDVLDFWQFEDQEYTLQELYGNYDYLILYAPDDRIRALLAENDLDPNAGFIELIQ